MNPQADALYPNTRGEFKPEMSEKMFLSLLGGCHPLGLQGLEKAKFQYISKWKEGPERVLQAMTKTAEGWALIETELRNRTKDWPV